MGFGIVHLSDMHFKEGEGGQLAKRVSAIAAAVRPRCSDLEAILLVLSGDISFSGKKSEFERARRFTDALLGELCRQTGLEIFGPVIVPGNHDCDFGRQGDVRPSLLGPLRTEVNQLNLEGDKVRQIVAPQDEFFAFEGSYSGSDRQGSSRLYFGRQFRLGERLVLVHCFNTAWVSRIKEQQGQILFPAHVEPLKSDERPTLSVSVFHHPYRWFEPTNGRQFQKLVERISDVIITGHEHEGDHFTHRTSRGEHLSYVEGVALETAELDTGFNFIAISFETNSYTVSKFGWNGSIYDPSQDVAENFVRNPRLSEEFFENTPEFERHLSQLGAAFPHPAAKRELELDDIFIYPDLRVRSFLNKKGILLSSEEVLEFVARERHVVVFGAPLSGKSTLAKKLYRDLRDEHKYVPVLLSGEDIKGRPVNALSRARDKAFREQYSPKRLENFVQLDPTKKALIVDDWHLAQLNKIGRRAFLGEAAKEFSVVVTLGADQTWFQDMLEAAELTGISDFHYCDIREFGYRLRGKLISKWHTLGKEFEADEEETSHLVFRSEQLLNSVVGKGLFPSFPFFVLYALQVSQLSKQNVITHGSFGHVYEAYLTMRLAEVSKKSTDVGMKYTYLSLIAYRLFEGRKNTFSPGELSEVHSRFETEYGIRTDQERMLQQLEDARILGHTGDSIAFMHKYCYYYFVAKYFQKLLANDPSAEGARQQLRDMADMVHDEEYMNILIFYIYLTEDRQLIEYFIERARTFFSEHQPCDFTRDVEFIGDLVTPRRLHLSSGNVEENREAYRAQKDQVTEALEQEDSRSTRTRYDRSLDDSLKLDFSFHAIQVMGQVLRNFPGDLRADLKCRLAEESYLLGLRTIKAFLSTLQTNLDAIRSAIETLLLMHKALPDDAGVREASRILAYLAEGGIYAMIKRVSLSVGLEDLRETYSAVRDKLGESNLPIRLIDLSIRLDHFPRLPMTDIEDLEHATHSLIVPFNILRMLVADHLYLFPVNYKIRQKLSTILNLETTRPLLADKRVKPTTERD